MMMMTTTTPDTRFTHSMYEVLTMDHKHGARVQRATWQYIFFAKINLRNCASFIVYYKNITSITAFILVTVRKWRRFKYSGFVACGSASLGEWLLLLQWNLQLSFWKRESLGLLVWHVANRRRLTHQKPVIISYAKLKDTNPVLERLFVSPDEAELRSFVLWCLGGKIIASISASACIRIPHHPSQTTT